MCAIGGFLSVALAFGSPRLAVSEHRALRSPDLPQPHTRKGTRPRPSSLLVAQPLSRQKAGIREFADFHGEFPNSRQNLEVVANRSNIPNTPIARRARVLELLSSNAIRSQAQLEALLSKDGLDVTQATLSRDLDELGAVKVRDEAGNLVYAAPEAIDGAILGSPDVREARVARVAAEVLVSVDVSANIAVLRTTIAAAQFFASALDLAKLEDVIGTVAGDDTVFVITKATDGAETFAKRIMHMAEKHTS